ncbi:MAG TPA: hypothetical protein VIU64_07895 [Polyangia bacterium]
MTRKLGHVQRDVLDALRRHGWWSSNGMSGWVWDTKSNTERVLRSLVVAGYAVAAREPGRGLVYRPTSARAGRVVLSDGSVVDGGSPLALLQAQYQVLMRLSKQYKNHQRIQSAVADANMLGLEVVDRLKEAEEGP